VRGAVGVGQRVRPVVERHVGQPGAQQRRSRDQWCLSVTKPGDVGFDPGDLLPEAVRVDVLIGRKGLPRQRNAGLDCVGESADIAVFFDDDYVPSRFALDRIAGAFAALPAVSGMTGHLIADGINAVGYSAAEAEQLVARYDAQTGQSDPPGTMTVRDDLIGLYGCNMAYRLSAVGDVRFDEALPLYGWQEDVDFAARIPGLRIKTAAFAGVHRGHKTSREVSGVKLGYSQLANPFYLWRKGTMPRRLAFRLAARNFLANHAKQFSPEPWIDRRGRVRGNWRALRDILLGRSDPARILEM